MNEQEAFIEGASIGHIDGQSSGGKYYVIGEEVEFARDRCVEHLPLGTSARVARSWERGYQYGYRLAAEGSPLLIGPQITQGKHLW